MDLGATCFFAHPAPWRVGIGAGIGSTEIIGEFHGPGGDLDISGTGLETHGQLEAEWSFTERRSLIGHGRYRDARVRDTMFNDASTHPDLESDFSGPYLRIGMAHDGR